jgi:hypothetical protein
MMTRGGFSRSRNDTPETYNVTAGGGEAQGLIDWTETSGVGQAPPLHAA